MAKKKRGTATRGTATRSAKQLANDKRLGLAAKKRAAAKRTGRKKKTTSRKVAKRKPAKRKRNPKQAVSKKPTLWIIFKCRGKSVSYVNFGSTSRFAFTPKKERSALFLSKSEATKIANSAARTRAGGNGRVGVARSDTTAAEIRAACNPKK